MAGGTRRKNAWHEVRDGSDYTLSRHWPARFDVSASARFPALRRGRLARQIRQDLWREFKHLRGFSPVIHIAATEDGFCVTAGGQFMAKGRVPQGAVSRIETLLDDPARRARWIAWAGEGAA
ncbi:hypothetical protein [Pacificoceanicola onchidii]|uniref:hypothetical protein n=1 Tax=Pacificoceanicola onchidii TaxID=2562685 RepID=UPI0010A59452|nr:hypothetical protein [Pacificoceanicola onchidii]